MINLLTFIITSLQVMIDDWIRLLIIYNKIFFHTYKLKIKHMITCLKDKIIYQLYYTLLIIKHFS